MRRASTCLALLGLAVLGVPGLASAAPTAQISTFKAKAVPIAKAAPKLVGAWLCE